MNKELGMLLLVAVITFAGGFFVHQFTGKSDTKNTAPAIEAGITKQEMTLIRQGDSARIAAAYHHQQAERELELANAWQRKIDIQKKKHEKEIARMRIEFTLDSVQRFIDNRYARFRGSGISQPGRGH